MARGDALTPGQFVRSVFFTFFGLALFSASLTVLFLGMRTILDVGGACASGGPYEIAVPCPDTAWTIPVSIFTGLAGLGIYLAGVWRLPGPNWAALAWPALFLSLGWNFWEYGLDPPEGMDGGAGFIVCGVAFVLMGGIPLVLILWNRDARRSLFWGKPVGSDDGRTPRDDPARKLRLRDTYGVMRDLRDSLAKEGIQNLVAAAQTQSASAPTSTGPASGPIVTPPPGPAPPDKTAEAEGLADALERLAALRRRGDLSDAEFQAAKTKLIDEGTTP